MKALCVVADFFVILYPLQIGKGNIASGMLKAQFLIPTITGAASGGA